MWEKCLTSAVRSAVRGGTVATAARSLEAVVKPGRSLGAAESCLGAAKRCLGTKTAVRELDPVQEALLTEPCILVDENDKAIGQASKRDCHAMKDGSSLLHRAFSLFIFNEKGELLLQKRSPTKITFPNMWTNTCCSHPLAVTEEMEEEGARGVRVAAQRRVNIELGIPASVIDPSSIQYLTRILYSAPSSGAWGEHELDYILLFRGNVLTKPNPDEVSAIEWVGMSDLDGFLAHVLSTGGEITPWFQLITQNLLPTWWKNLDRLQDFQDHQTIHKFN